VLFGRSKQTGIQLAKFKGNPCMGAGETSSLTSAAKTRLIGEQNVLIPRSTFSI